MITTSIRKCTNQFYFTYKQDTISTSVSTVLTVESIVSTTLIFEQKSLNNKMLGTWINIALIRKTIIKILRRLRIWEHYWQGDYYQDVAIKHYFMLNYIKSDSVYLCWDKW